MTRTLLWLGSGDATTPSLQFSDYDNVVLVDAHFSDFAAERFNKFDNVSLIKAGVWLQNGATLPFYVLNNEEYSSFSKPTGLKEIYPNILIDEVTEVEIKSPSELVEELGLEGKENTLVVDLPCVFLDVLNELSERDCLSFFRAIFVNAGKTQLYEASGTNDDVASLLSKKYFELCGQLSEDPDLVLSHYCFNKKLQTIDKLESKLSAVNQLNTTLSDENKKIKAENSQLQDALKKLTNENQQLETKCTDRDSEFQKEQSQKDELVKQLAKEQENCLGLQDVNSKLTSQLESLTERNVYFESENKLLHEKLDETKSSLQTNQAEIKSLISKCESLTGKNEQLVSTKRQLEDELQQAKSTLQEREALFAEIETKLLSCQQENEELVKQLAKEQESCLGLQDVNSKLTSQLELLTERNVYFESENKLLHEKLSESKSSLQTSQADIKSLISKCETLTGNNEQLVSTKRQLEDELQQAKSTLQEREALFAEIETKLLSCQTENEELTKQIIEEKKSVSQLDGEIKQLRAEVDNQVEKIASINSEKLNAVNSIEDELNEYKQKLSDTETRLTERESKYEEVYSWFSSRKQQVETLTQEIENLKRENASLKSNQETANAISQLEGKLTALIEKQSNDNIEIANALGQHVTKCTLEQRSTMASLFELRKLHALESLPIPYSDFSMDADNLSQLSSLVTLNSYDVIIEFGSGLSTLVAASAISKKHSLAHDLPHISLESLEHTSDNRLELSRVLPNYIVSFEQESKWFEQTRQLLSIARLDEYVEMWHAPLVNSHYKLEGMDHGLFYDCSEKLLELKRIFNNRKVKILVVVDGPENKAGDAKYRYAALPTVLDYLSHANLTVFLDGAKREDETKVIDEWKVETERRSLHFECNKLETPKGVAVVTITS